MKHPFAQDPNSFDCKVCRLERENPIHTAAMAEHEQLNRIEAKLDILLSALPPRQCTPDMEPHVHGLTVADVRSLFVEAAL